MQRYTIFFITVNAVHVSGSFSTHHQELKNLYLKKYISDVQSQERRILILFFPFFFIKMKYIYIYMYKTTCIGNNFQ